MTEHQAEWTLITSGSPPEGVTVETKIDDGEGCRNVRTLKRKGRLWFYPDASGYVYYTPTHWRELPEVER
jgi:hypothetical protein